MEEQDNRRARACGGEEIGKLARTLAVALVWDHGKAGLGLLGQRQIPGQPLLVVGHRNPRHHLPGKVLVAV